MIQRKAYIFTIKTVSYFVVQYTPWPADIPPPPTAKLEPPQIPSFWQACTFFWLMIMSQGLSPKAPFPGETMG